jgi:hypothetical protein
LALAAASPGADHRDVTGWLSLLWMSCALASPARVAQPEGPSPLVPGARLRILAPSVVASRFDGTLVGLEDASLTVDVGKGALVRVPRADVTRLEISVGRPRQTLRGLVIGAAAVAAVFALLPPADECADLPLCWTSRGAGAGYGAFLGATYGSLIGTFVRRDRWSPMTLTSASTTGHGRRVGVGVSFSF